MSEGFVPKKLNFVPRKPLDSTGRVGFGKYQFCRFQEVPYSYLRFLVDSKFNLKNYPNFEEYINRRLQYAEAEEDSAGEENR